MTKKQILDDLIELGISKGDTIFVTIDILRVGYFNKSREITLSDWVDIFKEIIGDSGGVVFASYTRSFLRFAKKDTLFHRFLDTYAGSLPNFIVSDTEAIRSTHPTNSVIGYGQSIKNILEKHNSNTLCYSVMGELIKIPDSKFVMIGTIDKKNAPQAMHFVQEELGYTKYSPYKYLKQIYYEENGKRILFTRRDVGGCSAGGYRLFAPLLVNNAVKFSNVGKAFSASMPAKKSYEIIKSELKKNKRIILCDDKDCIDCYGNPFYNGFGIIPFYVKLIFDFKNRILKRL